MAKMTEQEKQDWDELYYYIKFKILQYDKDLNLPKYFVLRIKGLTEGKFMSNKKIKSLGKYSYQDILLTFKMCKTILTKVLWNKSKFNNEKHIINTIMAIIERNINDVVIRKKTMVRNNKKLENINVSLASEIEYKKDETRNKEKIANKLKHLI